jgi:hypothetical protein
LSEALRIYKVPTCISRIIKGDKSWIYSYDPETKQQSSQWKSPQLPRAKEGMAGSEFNKESFFSA